MTISHFSCISSFYTCLLFLFFIFFIRKRFYFSSISDVRRVTFIYFLFPIRLIFPLDLKITQGIPFRGLYTSFYNFFFLQKFEISGIHISPFSVLFLTVLIISFIRIFLYIRMYCQIARQLNSYSPYDSPQLCSVLKKIQEVYPNLPKCSIYRNNITQVPLAVGILNKKIILPEITYSDSEFFYVLLHEYTHLRKHDLLKKYFIDLGCAFFWWIPFRKFIIRDIEQLIEIQCDQTVLQNLHPADTYAYMSTLINAVKRSSHSSTKIGSKSLAFCFSHNINVMVERCRLLSPVSSDKKKKPIFYLSGLLVFFLSYIFVPSPYFQPDIEDITYDRATAITPEDESNYLYQEGNQYFFVTKGFPPISISEKHAYNLIDYGIQVKLKEVP